MDRKTLDSIVPEVVLSRDDIYPQEKDGVLLPLFLRVKTPNISFFDGIESTLCETATLCNPSYDFPEQEIVATQLTKPLKKAGFFDAKSLTFIINGGGTLVRESVEIEMLIRNYKELKGRFPSNVTIEYVDFSNEMSHYGKYRADMLLKSIDERGINPILRQHKLDFLSDEYCQTFSNIDGFVMSMIMGNSLQNFSPEQVSRFLENQRRVLKTGVFMQSTRLIEYDDEKTPDFKSMVGAYDSDLNTSLMQTIIQKKFANDLQTAKPFIYYDRNEHVVVSGALVGDVVIPFIRSAFTDKQKLDQQLHSYFKHVAMSTDERIISRSTLALHPDLFDVAKGKGMLAEYIDRDILAGIIADNDVLRDELGRIPRRERFALVVAYAQAKPKVVSSAKPSIIKDFALVTMAMASTFGIIVGGQKLLTPKKEPVIDYSYTETTNAPHVDDVAPRVSYLKEHDFPESSRGASNFLQYIDGQTDGINNLDRLLRNPNLYREAAKVLLTPQGNSELDRRIASGKDYPVLIKEINHTGRSVVDRFSLATLLKLGFMGTNIVSEGRDEYLRDRYFDLNDPRTQRTRHVNVREYDCFMELLDRMNVKFDEKDEITYILKRKAGKITGDDFIDFCRFSSCIMDAVYTLNADALPDKSGGEIFCNPVTGEITSKKNGNYETILRVDTHYLADVYLRDSGVGIPIEKKLSDFSHMYATDFLKKHVTTVARTGFYLSPKGRIPPELIPKAEMGRVLSKVGPELERFAREYGPKLLILLR